MPFNPTPLEIEEACREIRSHWDDREHERRAGLAESRIARWLPPGPLRTPILDRDNLHSLRARGIFDGFN